MGIVEAQTRARIEGLKAEREAAQKSLEALTLTMTQSLEDVAEAIRHLPDMPKWSLPGDGGGGGGSSSSLLASPSLGSRVETGASSRGVDLGLLVDQIAAQMHFMQTEIPKAIVSAMQKAAA
jgi:hypothetical protein